MHARRRIRGDAALRNTAARPRHLRYDLLLERLGADPPGCALGTPMGASDRARARLAMLAPRQRDLQQVQSSLASATTALNSVAAFERSRQSATLLLAEVALALPDSTAVTTLHVDSLGGTLTLLAPRAASALEAVSGLPLMARVQMNGAVTREIAGGVQLERASLRFTFARGKPSREASKTDVARVAIVAERRPHGGTQ